jgi:predicted nucleic acid-binding protein
MYLLDTNVISELRKRDRARSDVVAWAAQAEPSGFFLSTVTILELRYGALLVQRRDPRQGDMMLRWILQDVLAGFAERILPVDVEVALRCAGLHVPDRRPDRDAMIGATALVHDLTLVTRNVRDFRPMGVRIFDPWQAEA